MSNRKVTMEFDIADLPMIASALRTASCEAMMTSRPKARERLDAYRRVIDRMIPAPARVFTGQTWAEICIALDGAKAYSVGFEEWGYDWKEGRGGKYGKLTVTVGDRRWGSDEYRHFRDGGSREAIIELLGSMAPLDCVHVPVEDTEASHRRPHRTAAAPSPRAPEPRFVEDDDDYDDGYDGGGRSPGI